jgi:hypothetical protein
VVYLQQRYSIDRHVAFLAQFTKLLYILPSFFLEKKMEVEKLVVRTVRVKVIEKASKQAAC